MEIEPKFCRPIDIQYQDGDSTKLKEELGWEPKIKIEDTLK
jgi:GDP-D-mannose dehydratase